MPITIRYFASLRESTGRSEDIVPLKEQTTVAELWLLANNGCPLPDNTLAAINMEYVNMNAEVKDGDEVAFFPPVTGGMICA